MNRKPIIVFVLAMGVALAAQAAVSHHRAAIIGRAIFEHLSSMPTANEAADSSKAEPVGSSKATGARTTAAQTIEVPAGTTLTVRLGEKLGSKISRAGQSFSATLDHDVVVDGQTVIAAGASVNGEVAFARPGGALVAEPNLQIKLTSVSVKNADLAVVTSTRSFGPTVEGKKRVGRIIKGVIKRGSIGCTFTANPEICKDLIQKATGKEKEVLLADQSAFSFTLRQPLEIQ
jgi:hypothetical protein